MDDGIHVALGRMLSNLLWRDFVSQRTALISTAKQPNLPNLLVIGSQKAGTTALHLALAQHPDIFMTPTKEVNFFFHRARFEAGLSHYGHYFCEAGSEKIVGESSPGYICHPEAPRRIAQSLDRPKLLLTVRHPVDRAYSQYWDNRCRLAEDKSFEEAYQENFSTIYRPGAIGYFSRGFYSSYIEAYLKFFSREQLMIIVAEELWADPVSVYPDIFRFLEVDDSFRPLDVPRNSPELFDNPLYRFFVLRPRWLRFLPIWLRQRLKFGPRKPFAYPPIDPILRAALTARYGPSIKALEALLGRKIPRWAR